MSFSLDQIKHLISWILKTILINGWLLKGVVINLFRYRPMFGWQPYCFP